MKIIILGAGQVGGTLAENLVGENNDITVVDTNGDRLRSLQDKFDLRVVQGMVHTHACCVRRVPTMPTCWLR
jgi:trk system potassium uptake protein TrkA